MIFSNGAKIRSALGLFLCAILVISCSEKNSPALRNGSNSTFYVDTLTTPANFLAVGEPNSQGKYNKKLLSLEACLKDIAQTNSVSNLRFDIVAGDVTMEKSTDTRGCIQWQELVEFDPNDEDKNELMSREIVARQSHSGTEKLNFTINLAKSEFQYIRNGTYKESVSASPVSFKLQQFLANGQPVNGDVANSQVIYVKINSRIDSQRLGRPARQTEIETLNLDSKGVDWFNLKLDQNLNIIFPYKYYTRFSISLLKQKLDGIGGEIIKKGDFKFYIVVLKENVDLNNPKASDVLGTAEFSATPRGDAGLITVPITLNFDQVTSITNRVNFLFTIASLDTPAMFPDQNFEGFSNGLVANKDLAIKLYPANSSAQNLHNEHIALQESLHKRVQSVSDALVQAGSVKMDVTAVRFKAADIHPTGPVTSKLQIKPKSELIDHRVDLGAVIANLKNDSPLKLVEEQAVCAAYFIDSNGKFASASLDEYNRCLANPGQYLDASVSEMVESVNQTLGSSASVMDVETLKMTAQFELTDEKTVTAGYEYGASIDGKAGFQFGAFEKKDSVGSWVIMTLSQWLLGFKPVLEVNASVNGKASYLTGVEKKEKDSNTATIVTEKEISSVPLRITMNAKVAKCMIVKRKPGSLAQLPASRHFCTKATEMTRTEYYYLVDYFMIDKSRAVVLDQFSGAVNPFHILVRGKSTYVSLRDSITNKVEPLRFKMTTIDEKQLQNPANYMTQLAPLVLSTKPSLLTKRVLTQ